MRDVVGYNGLYAVDENGNVWSYRKNDWLSPGLNSNGYYQVNLWKDEKRKTYLVHRLVAMTYLDNYAEDMQVDHINGDKQNNKLQNLRMVTGQKNQWNRTTAKGYCWDKNAGKWRPFIKVNGKTKNLGCFDTEQEARDAYLAAKKILHVI